VCGNNPYRCPRSEQAKHSTGIQETIINVNSKATYQVEEKPGVLSFQRKARLFGEKKAQLLLGEEARTL